MSQPSGNPPSSANGKPMDVEFDQTWPVFTVDGTGVKPAAPGDQTPNVTAVLRDLLGWRPTPKDAKSFTAALAAAFTLKTVEGHVESEYVPRGFAMQADLGSVSGGQASLYARAQSSLVHMLGILDGLTPLLPAFDLEDTAATRALVRNELSRIVEEIGAPGGPRQALVESSFTVLLGTVVVVDPPPLPDDVEGQLGELRDRFGLTSQNVNTVEEERVRTAFWTLTDEVQDLRRAWENWKQYFTEENQSGFLGTDLVLLSRLMEAASEQVDEYENVLDSVLIGPAERQTIPLRAELSSAGLTLDGLLSWTRRFLREDGPAYLSDSGRIGLAKAYTPTAHRLIETYRCELIKPLGLDDGQQSISDGQYDPPGYLPRGLSAARSKVALRSLYGLLQQLDSTASAAAPEGLLVQEARLADLTVGTKTERKLKVTLRLAELPAGGRFWIEFPEDDRGRRTVPVAGTDTQCDGVLSGCFDYSPQRISELENLQRWNADGIEVPVHLLPLLIRELTTDEVVFESAATDWAGLEIPEPPGGGSSDVTNKL